MYVTSLSDDITTGESRLLIYDAEGYSLITGVRLVSSRRLDAICYLFDSAERSTISRLHGLQDAGEYKRARDEADADAGHA